MEYYTQKKVKLQTARKKIIEFHVVSSAAMAKSRHQRRSPLRIYHNQYSIFQI